VESLKKRWRKQINDALGFAISCFIVMLIFGYSGYYFFSFSPGWGIILLISSILLLAAVLKAASTMRIFMKRISLVENYEKKQIVFSEELKALYETLKARADAFGPNVIHFTNKTVVVKKTDRKQVEAQFENLLDAYKK